MARKKKKPPGKDDSPLEEILFIENPWIKACVFVGWLCLSAWLALDDFHARKNDPDDED